MMKGLSQPAVVRTGAQFPVFVSSKLLSAACERLAERGSGAGAARGRAREPRGWGRAVLPLSFKWQDFCESETFFGSFIFVV